MEIVNNEKSETRLAALDVGGSIGSIKGGFYEKHFGILLKSLGYEIIDANTFKEKKDLKNIVVHKYRTAPDEFTEVDFYIPSKKIGFWVTNLGQISRFREVGGSAKDFNEFKELTGICSHCKKTRLPNDHAEVISNWTCSKCKSIVNPFDLLSKKSITGKEIENFENKSASTQAHKQAYYRIGEYIEARTCDDKMKCVEIIYNNRKDWRKWQ